MTPQGINFDTRLWKEKKMIVIVKYIHFPKMTFCLCFQKSGGILSHINENKLFDNEYFASVPNAISGEPCSC